MDGDLQNDPADIPAMMQRLDETASDMVIGVRVNRADTWSRKMQSKIGNGVRNWITGDRIPLAIRLMPYDQKHPLPEWYRASGARRLISRVDSMNALPKALCSSIPVAIRAFRRCVLSPRATRCQIRTRVT